MGNSLACDILVPNIDALSYKDWLQVRKSGIGGSDVAACMSLSPWKSPLELWQEKTSEEAPPRTDNEAMLWGRIMEPIITQEFMRRTGLSVKPMRSMLKHPLFPMLADLDGIIEDPKRGPGVFEVKTASAFKQSEWSFKQSEWAENRCPDMYYLQVQHYLEVTGLSYAVIVVLIGGNSLSWLTIEPDRELIENMVELERGFWRHVETRTPPPIDGSESASSLLSRLYPSSSNVTPMILPQEADSWITDWQQAKTDEDAAADRKRLAENRLKEVLQDHEKATSPSGHLVTWKTITANKLDTARLKKEEPAITERYTTTATSRRFSVSEPK